jgi:hypothetical protein
MAMQWALASNHTRLPMRDHISKTVATAAPLKGWQGWNLDTAGFN